MAARLIGGGCLCAGLLATWSLGVANAAPILNNWSSTLNAGNTGDFLNDYSEDKNWQVRSSVGLVGAAGTQGAEFRYASLLAMEVRFGNSSLEQAGTDYQIEFDVVAGPTEDWWVKVEGKRRGRLWVRHDGCGWGRAEIENAINAECTVSGGSTVAMPNLSFAAPTAANNQSDDNNDSSPTIQTQNGIHCIVGTGSKHVTLRFRWLSTVSSNPNGGVCAHGDESAALFGLSGSLPNTTADNYPTSGESESQHGHFVKVTLAPAPTGTVTSESVCTSTQGAPCYLNLAGTASGCLGSNYQILVHWSNAAGPVGTATTTVSNGSLSWLSTLAVPGMCGNFPYTYTVEAIDLPGLIAGDDLESAPRSEPVRLAEGTVTELDSNPCSLTPVPGFGPWSGLLALLATALLGLVALRRRARFG